MRSFAVILGLGIALGLVAEAAAQTPLRRIDCGDLNGFETGEPGYELFTEVSTPADVDLTPAPLDTVHIAGNFPDFFGTQPLQSEIIAIDGDRVDEAHLFTAFQLDDFTILTLSNLDADTPYRVRLELGALAPWGDPVGPNPETCFHNPPGSPCWNYFSTVSKEVQVEVFDPGNGFEIVASGIRCASSHRADTYYTTLPFYGAVIPVWVLAKTDKTGVLRIRLSTDGTDPLFLTAFELHEYEALPVVYKRTASDPLIGSTGGVAGFVAAFNAGDFGGAETVALGMADDFERGVALAHLVGWLDGGRDGNFHLIDETRTALTAASDSHPGAAWLLDELETLQRALDHVRGAGFTKTFQCPDQGGLGFVNKTCANQVDLESPFGLDLVNTNAAIAVRELRGITAAATGTTVLGDLVDWNAGTLSSDYWEPSPYVFAALKLMGATMVQINPNLNVASGPGNPEGIEMDADKRAIFDDFNALGFATTDFPTDLELRLFDRYLDNSAAPKDWAQFELQTIFTDEELDASWWGGLVALPDDVVGAPHWANRQRKQMKISRNLNRYWLEDRFADNEVGGGWGDDVEVLAGLFGKVAGTWNDQTDRKTLDAIESMVRYGMLEQGTVQDGYHAGPTTDVEHSAEYTTDPFIALRAVYGHTAMAGEIGLGVAKQMLNTANPSLAFAGPTTLSRLHMKSQYFDSFLGVATGVEDIDILLNGRAMYPGVSAALHMPLPDTHPLVADLSAWAAAWRDDAEDTSGGKPLGFLAPVQWDSNDFGESGFWWTHTGSVGNLAAFSDISYILELNRMAYHQSGASDRWKYLVPAARMLRAVKDWEDGGTTGGLGTATWAASKLKAGGRFGNVVIAHYADLADDADLTTLIPSGGSVPYVDTPLLDRMRTWVETEFNGQSNSLRYALGDVEPCTGTAKSGASLLPPYDKIVDYYRVAFPLLTLQVIHTDRVFMNYEGAGPTNTLSAATATAFVEGLANQPLVRWESHFDDGLDIAIQTNFKAYDGTAYSAFVYNFEKQAVDIDLLLDEGLIPGEYLVEWGDAVQTCDVFPSGATIGSAVVQKRGKGIGQTVVLVPGLNLVRATRQGAADMPAADYDLATDPPVIDVVVDGLEVDLSIGARVINLGNDASPTATMNIYGSVLAADGTVVLMGGTTAETLVDSIAVSSLAGLTDWTPAEFSVSVPVPISSPLWQDLPADGGFQARVEIVPADGLDNDLLNNDQRRGWFFAAQLPDCNTNGVPDVADIAGGADDCNGNTALDACELGRPIVRAPGDPLTGMTSRTPATLFGAGDGPGTGPAPQRLYGCAPSDADTDGNCVIDTCE